MKINEIKTTDEIIKFTSKILPIPNDISMRDKVKARFFYIVFLARFLHIFARMENCTTCANTASRMRTLEALYCLFILFISRQMSAFIAILTL